jgi:hypothetical protein
MPQRLSREARMIGRTLGHYEIVDELGSGGMGVVYRARDPRLGREVAIKVLPESVATDAGRLSRFEREVKAVAALSHPNILAIHEFGTEGKTVFAVMELLEGQTLRQRLARGPLPRSKAVEAGVQVARALAAAHDKGIVHRDLKPDNIWVTAEGQVKVLDFGLACFHGGPPEPEAKTMTRATDPGSIMGTAAYMSPEQARGETVDTRSDVFSLGAVLYEMLTGRLAFARPTAAQTMTAVLQDDPPDMDGTPQPLPPILERTVRHCLEKEPGERFQTARDLAFALSGVSEPGTAGFARGVGERTGTRRLSWPAAVGLAVLAVVATALLAFSLVGRSSSPERAEVTRWEVSLGRDQELLVRGRSHPLALSSDGKQLAYVATDGGESRLYVRAVDEFDAVPLVGTEGARNPFLLAERRVDRLLRRGRAAQGPERWGSDPQDLRCAAGQSRVGLARGRDHRVRLLRDRPLAGGSRRRRSGGADAG